MATHFSIYSAADKAFQAIRARFMQDILQREEATKGKEARQHLQFMLATTDHLDDVMAGLVFIENYSRHRPEAAGDYGPLIRWTINLARDRTG